MLATKHLLVIGGRPSGTRAACHWEVYFLTGPNTDEPQPKEIKHRENGANRDDNTWILFGFAISVDSVFSVLKSLCFFLQSYHL